MNFLKRTVKLRQEYKPATVFNCSIIPVRNRYFDIKRPRTHFKRELIKEITKPRFKKPRELYQAVELCGQFIKNKLDEFPKEYYPLDVLLGEQVRQQICNAKFVAVFHRHPINWEQLYSLRIDLNKIGLQYVHHNKTIINLALLGTSYEPLLKLYEERTLTFVGEEADFKKLLKIEKRSPIVTVIGGVYEGRIISTSQMMMLADRPDIKQHFVELVGILSVPSQNLSSYLIHHQTNLSQCLQRYVTDENNRNPCS